MAVNENKIVINLKGSFQQESYRGLLKDFLAQGLDNLLAERTPTVQGQSLSQNHKQISIGYNGPRIDQMKLDGVFTLAKMALPSLSYSDVKREAPTSADTTTYTIEAAF